MMDHSDPILIAPTPLRRLLVVDDEEIVLVALRETLARAGYQVVATGSAEEALERMRELPFAVIITDQQMPRMTGLEFLAQAKEVQPYATRILITAVLNLGTVIEAINSGEIYRFVLKPWLREEFLAAVQSAVQRYDLIAGNARLRAAAESMNERLVALNERLEAQVARVADQNRQLEALNRALDQNLQHSVELCVRTMETYYPTLGNQARRVYELCRSMAVTARLSEEESRALGVAAWLHDIGLVGVPRRLIRRWEQSPESLTVAERTVVEQHPVLGSELAGFVADLRAVPPVIRSHHERFDGRGYPDCLSGTAIPWLGRLLAVAVALGGSALPEPVALESMMDESGRAYDPEALNVLRRSLPRTQLPRREREVTLADLRPGMVVAQGIYTASGVLLVPDGHELNDTYIDKLRNHDRMTPIAPFMRVYC
jgi:response regulator RpfG family c-di-GMP phosphodiesterase